MKIDLHCHTLSTKKGDGVGRNVSPEVFRSKIEMADVKIVAITNHNYFDLMQFNALKTAVEDICLVWPGIEIDAKGTVDRFHLIVICNPDTDHSSATVNELAGLLEVGSSRVKKLLYELVDEQIIVAEGADRNRTYRLKS